VRLFQNLKIRNRLIGIILIISFISLGLSFGLTIFYKYRADRLSFIDDVKRHAELVGEYCKEAMSSSARNSLEKSLSSFHSIPYVMDSVIFGPEEKILASYHSSGEKFVPSDPKKIKPFEFKNGYVVVLVSISDEEQTYGKIFVRASTDKLKNNLKITIITMSVLFLLIFVLVYFLARGFQKVVSKPISNLVTATKKISGPDEAGVRIKKEKKNEFLILRDRLKYLLDLENLREMKLEEVGKARKKVIELEKKGKEYRERFENIAYGIFLLEAVDNGENFIVKDLNNTGEKLERIHRADLTGKKIADVFPEVRNSGLLDALKNVWQNDTEEYIPYSKLKKGDNRWREFFINKLPSQDIAAAFRDVTEKKKEEESRQRQQEKEKKSFEEILKQHEDMKITELEENVHRRALNNELDDFFSATANYLEDPLEKINNFSKSFLNEYADKVDDEGKDQLIKLRAANLRMIKMVGKFNELAELSFDRLKLEKVNLSEMVRKRAVKLKEGSAERKAEFIIKKGIEVRGDARMLSILIDNLLTNAWIYSSKEKNVKIEFGVKKSKNKKEYYIKDNGIGFDMKDVDEMFLPFKKLNPDEVFPGFGMGLAVARRIVHKHGGIIRAEGKPGEGAVFYFTLGT